MNQILFYLLLLFDIFNCDRTKKKKKACGEYDEIQI